jgi:nucleoid-associated protein YgaU
MSAPSSLTILKSDDKSELFKCRFNPPEYSTKRTNCFKAQGGVAAEADNTFTSGNPEDFTFDLLLDMMFQSEGTASSASSGGSGSDPLDIRPMVQKLSKCMDIVKKDGTERGEPPVCVLQWGGGFEFVGQMSLLEVKYTLFSAAGTPIRGHAKVSFKRKLEVSQAQNPTSHAIPGYKRRTVRPGETLAYLAHQEYGSAAEWRRLADANRLSDPLEVRAGMRLDVPLR